MTELAGVPSLYLWAISVKNETLVSFERIIPLSLEADPLGQPDLAWLVGKEHLWSGQL